MAARTPLRSLLVALLIGTVGGGLAAPAALRLLTAMGVADPSGVVPAMAGATCAVAAATLLAIGVTLAPAMKRSPAELLRTD
jgi:hypothetical protein